MNRLWFPDVLSEDTFPGTTIQMGFTWSTNGQELRPWILYIVKIGHIWSLFVIDFTLCCSMGVLKFEPYTTVVVIFSVDDDGHSWYISGRDMESVDMAIIVLVQNNNVKT